MGFLRHSKPGSPIKLPKMRTLSSIKPPSHVIALGKAAGAMADAVRDCGYDGPGLVITTDENHRHIDGFNCIASAHPFLINDSVPLMPLKKLASGLSETDHLLLLISGGGSALLPAPASGISSPRKWP